MNYRSVVVLGTATPVTSRDEKLAALEAFTEKLLPGRWAEARQPTPKELKATSVLRLPLDEASAKIRDGGPEDGDSPDAELDVWAGTSRSSCRRSSRCPTRRSGRGSPFRRRSGRTGARASSRSDTVACVRRDPPSTRS